MSIFDVLSNRFKLYLIISSGQFIEPHVITTYDVISGTAKERLVQSWFLPRLAVKKRKFLVDKTHIKTGVDRQLWVLVDAVKQRSKNIDNKIINFDGESIDDKTATLPTALSEELKNRLSYMSERAYWEALIGKVRLATIELLMAFLAGIGGYFVLKTFGARYGVYLP